MGKKFRIYLNIRNNLNFMHSLVNAFFCSSNLYEVRVFVRARNGDFGSSLKFKLLKFLALLSQNKPMVFSWNPNCITCLEKMSKF